MERIVFQNIHTIYDKNQQPKITRTKLTNCTDFTDFKLHLCKIMSMYLLWDKIMKGLFVYWRRGNKVNRKIICSMADRIREKKKYVYIVKV